MLRLQTIGQHICIFIYIVYYDIYLYVGHVYVSRVLMGLLMQLRKVCNHTYLSDLCDDAPDPYCIDERLVQGSGKLMLLDRLLPRLRVDGHRVLIFSQFTSTLDLLEDYCELRDYPCARVRYCCYYYCVYIYIYIYATTAAIMTCVYIYYCYGLHFLLLL